MGRPSGRSPTITSRVTVALEPSDLDLHKVKLRRTAKPIACVEGIHLIHRKLGTVLRGWALEGSVGGQVM